MPLDTQTPVDTRNNVIKLGWVSLFNDAASEMLYPIMPMFMTLTLGVSPAIMGLIDGLAEGAGSALRWIGGALSDRYRRRKPFVLAGYVISALSKPVMGLAALVWGWPLFLVGRCADRMGKSVRNAARDALLAASVDSSQRGWAFGFQRAMDTCGAVIGPLVALAVVAWVAGFGNVFGKVYSPSAALHPLLHLPLTRLFFVALIPGVLTVLCVAVVREIRPRPGEATKTGGKPPPMFQRFPAPFYALVLAGTVFSLGNSSDLFLLLRSGQLGLSFGTVILAYVGYNMIYAAASTPLGRWSDRIGRKRILMAGWAVYAAVYLGFALLHGAWTPWVLLGTYGLYQAMADGMTGALISDVVGDSQRAGAVGLFNMCTGLAQLTASVVAGQVYSLLVWHGRIMLPFLLGALCALAAIPLLARVGVGKVAK